MLSYTVKILETFVCLVSFLLTRAILGPCSELMAVAILIHKVDFYLKKQINKNISVRKRMQ